MSLQSLSARVVLGVASGLLALGSVVLSGSPLGPPSALAHVLSGAPVAQCAGATEAEAWHGRYGATHVAVEHQYYCGPSHAYSPEWYAAHIGAYPQYYTAYAVEPTTCGTYHFYYENGWYCYTGP